MYTHRHLRNFTDEEKLLVENPKSSIYSVLEMLETFVWPKKGEKEPEVQASYSSLLVMLTRPHPETQSTVRCSKDHVKGGGGQWGASGSLPASCPGRDVSVVRGYFTRAVGEGITRITT